MPRKLRRPKVRRGTVEVSRARCINLLWRDFHAAIAMAERDATSRADAWCLIGSGGSHSVSDERAWLSIEDDALVAWSTFFPGTRPAAWWYYSAPELRRVEGAHEVIAGVNRCHPTGVPYIDRFDWADPPAVEASAAYLDRLKRFLPGERARCTAADFEPQSFSFELCEAPSGMPAPDAWPLFRGEAPLRDVAGDTLAHQGTTAHNLNPKSSMTEVRNHE